MIMDDTCKHEWKSVDSQWDNEIYTTVRCKYCWMYGDLDERTGEIYYPAT